MTTFEVPETRATLVLTEEPYAGAEIEVSLELEWGLYKEMRRLAALPRDESWEANLDALIALFAPRLRGWNLTRNGESLPATAEGIARLGPALIGEIISTWIGAVGTGTAPLGSGSPPSEPGSTRRRSRARKP